MSIDGEEINDLLVRIAATIADLEVGFHPCARLTIEAGLYPFLITYPVSKLVKFKTDLLHLYFTREGIHVLSKDGVFDFAAFISKSQITEYKLTREFVLTISIEQLSIFLEAAKVKTTDAMNLSFEMDRIRAGKMGMKISSRFTGDISASQDESEASARLIFARLNDAREQIGIWSFTISLADLDAFIKKASKFDDGVLFTVSPSYTVEEVVEWLGNRGNSSVKIVSQTTIEAPGLNESTRKELLAAFPCAEVFLAQSRGFKIVIPEGMVGSDTFIHASAVDDDGNELKQFVAEVSIQEDAEARTDGTWDFDGKQKMMGAWVSLDYLKYITSKKSVPSKKIMKGRELELKIAGGFVGSPLLISEEYLDSCTIDFLLGTRVLEDETDETDELDETDEDLET